MNKNTRFKTDKGLDKVKVLVRTSHGGIDRCLCLWSTSDSEREDCATCSERDGIYINNLGILRHAPALILERCLLLACNIHILFCLTLIFHGCGLSPTFFGLVAWWAPIPKITTTLLLSVYPVCLYLNCRLNLTARVSYECVTGSCTSTRSPRGTALTFLY